MTSPFKLILAELSPQPLNEKKFFINFTTKCKVCVQPGNKTYTDPNFDEM